MKNKVLAGIDREFKGSIEIKHVVRVLYEDVGVDEIKRAVTNPLKMKVAAHYGCHLLKPSGQIRFEDPEDPKSLDELIKATGAESINYFDKNLCCGGFVLGADKDIAYNLTGQKLQNVKDADADVMVTACPFCHVMYDANQRAIENELQKKYGIRYYTTRSSWVWRWALVSKTLV
jgi:heterodisulfide reductase subunit B